MKIFSFLIFTLMIVFISCTTDKTPFQQQTDDLDGLYPDTYDLRDVNGINYVTSVKSQTGGTCWTHGTMASVESNLLMHDNWTPSGNDEEPDLAEYHLDWWNGFNQHWNKDIFPTEGSGLEVHMGGDYYVATAYFSRLHGPVMETGEDFYQFAPSLKDENYIRYYPKHIEWLSLDNANQQRSLVKEKLMENGVIATSLLYDQKLINEQFVHYQPVAVEHEPNHSVAIIGWDNNKITQADKPGAWLCKNSWGSYWGLDGYFWISYYDKHCGKNPDMGAVTFRDVEILQYDTVYYHDFHGWRDTKMDSEEAFNAYTAIKDENLAAVSFYTAENNVQYEIIIYDDFIDGELQNPLGSHSGRFAYKGFHTVDFLSQIEIKNGNDFFVYLYLSDGGQPMDCTSDVPVLLGADTKTIVESSASPHQSYYYYHSQWNDLYDDNNTANFCIKALMTTN